MSLFSELTKTAARYGVAEKTAGRGLIATGLGFLATRIATKSIPGAIAVGGGLLAKTLWDRKREKDAEKKATSVAPIGEPADAADIDVPKRKVS